MKKYKLNRILRSFTNIKKTIVPLGESMKHPLDWEIRLLENKIKARTNEIPSAYNRLVTFAVNYFEGTKQVTPELEKVLDVIEPYLNEHDEQLLQPLYYQLGNFRS